MFPWRCGSTADVRNDHHWLLGRKHISKLLVLAKVPFIPIGSLVLCFANFLIQIFVFRVLVFKGKCLCFT